MKQLLYVTWKIVFLYLWQTYSKSAWVFVWQLMFSFFYRQPTPASLQIYLTRNWWAHCVWTGNSRWAGKHLQLFGSVRPPNISSLSTWQDNNKLMNVSFTVLDVLILCMAVLYSLEDSGSFSGTAATVPKDCGLLQGSGFTGLLCSWHYLPLWAS